MVALPPQLVVYQTREAQLACRIVIHCNVRLILAIAMGIFFLDQMLARPDSILLLGRALCDSSVQNSVNPVTFPKNLGTTSLVRELSCVITFSHN